MKLIFTTSDAALSRLIRWAFKEPVSHCGVLFDRKLVIHSSVFGVDLQGIYAFLKKSRIVNEISIDLTLEQEEAIYQALIKRYEGEGYDYRAFAYFVWRGVLFRFCGVPFPDKNAWQRPDDFLCDGFLAALDVPESPEWLRKALKDLGDIEMKSPHAVFLAISKAQPAKSTQDER